MAMRYIGVADQEKIRARFESELEGDVRLVLFVQPPTGLFIPGREEPQTGRQAQALMEELAALSDKVTLEVHNPRLEPELAQQYGVERSPALILLPATNDPGTRQRGEGETTESPRPPVPASGDEGSMGLVRFFGLPSGYEFSTLLEDIVDVSRGKTRLSEATREAVSALTTPVHLQVFVTPT